jgi:tetratricopeptide (TPR) repeat protein
MKYFYILLVMIVFLFSGRVGAQQVAMNNEKERPSGNVYSEIDRVSSLLISDPQNEKLLSERSLMYAKIGEYEKALSDIDQGLSSHPESYRLYYTKTLILLRRQHTKSALEAIEKAVELEANENNLYLRATVYASLGETREAILDINSILALNPRCDYCYLQKALWCSDMNMYYEEIKNYLYYIKVSTDEVNVNIIKERIKKMKRHDPYFADLIKNAKKEIRKNGYPWEYHVWE